MKSAARTRPAVVAGMALALAEVVAVELSSSVAHPLTALPSTAWFTIAMLAALPIACLLGVQCGRRVPSLVETPGRRGNGLASSSQAARTATCQGGMPAPLPDDLVDSRFERSVGCGVDENQ